MKHKDFSAEVLADYSDRITEYVVRAVELILLAGAFGYAALKSGSVAASIVALVLVALAANHIGLRAVIRTAEWIGRRNRRRRLWHVVAIAFGSSLAGVIVAAAVLALYRVILSNAP